MPEQEIPERCLRNIEVDGEAGARLGKTFLGIPRVEAGEKASAMRGMKTALIGAGGRGLGHARALNASPAIDFLVVCDLDLERSMGVAEEYGVEAYTSVEDVLEMSDLESVVIVTQSKDHAELSIRSLEAGKNVLCEKPIADSIEAAHRMVEAARSSGRSAVIGYQRRFEPAFWTLKRITGELDPIQITLTGQRGIFLEKYLHPGSAYGIMDAACHQVDLVNWLMGRSPRAVCGSVRTGVFTPTRAIDTASIHVEYGGGDESLAAAVMVSMGGTGMSNFCHILGRNGNAEMEDRERIKMTRVHFDPGAGVERERQVTSTEMVDCEVLSGGDSTLALMSAFAGHVRGEDTKIATFDDGFKALLVLEATLLSSQRGARVNLDELVPGR